MANNITKKPNKSTKEIIKKKAPSDSTKTMKKAVEKLKPKPHKG